MPSRVIHFEIQADDLGRAKAFYEKTFGWKVEKWSGNDSMAMNYWMLATGPDGAPGINGGMYQRPKDNPLHTFDCTLAVDNIDKAMEMVKQNGGTIRSEKMELMGVGWFARATDPEGNIFGLMQAAEPQLK